MNPGTAQQRTETSYPSYDVLSPASALLSKVLVSDISRQRCAGIIVETEAYRGADDRACFSLAPRDSVDLLRGGSSRGQKGPFLPTLRLF
ncbi:MAG: DNA-3-methyladenine glycosylase, partial [Haliscomenobacter sp.]